MMIAKSTFIFTESKTYSGNYCKNATTIIAIYFIFSTDNNVVTCFHKNVNAIAILFINFMLLTLAICNCG